MAVLSGMFLTAAALLLPMRCPGAEALGTTPNEFLAREGLTIIVGTAGDESADRAIRAQATMFRDLLFPAAEILEDQDFDPAKGARTWPPNPILYGGPHVHHVLAKFGNVLPFRMSRGTLQIGDEDFRGDEYRLIALVPARAPDEGGPGYPEFLLYAGNGSPGVVEINSVRHGGEPILVADDFGRLLAGTWRRSADGTLSADLPGPRARRIAWRSVDRALTTDQGSAGFTVHFRFPRQLPAGSDEEAVIQAGLRGLKAAARKLGEAGRKDLTVYIYPDPGSVASLTGRRGDGYAVVESRVLHVVRADPAQGGGFEKLLAHEGTHVIAQEVWGLPGSPLLGEGLAVWAAGAYAGVSLDAWKRRIRHPVPAIHQLLGPLFRQMPENQSYPLAGILVDVAVERVGRENVRRHLYGATASSWEEACKAAGTTSNAIEEAVRAMMVNEP